MSGFRCFMQDRTYQGGGSVGKQGTKRESLTSSGECNPRDNHLKPKRYQVLLKEVLGDSSGDTMKENDIQYAAPQLNETLIHSGQRREKVVSNKSVNEPAQLRPVQTSAGLRTESLLSAMQRTHVLKVLASSLPCCENHTLLQSAYTPQPCRPSDPRPLHSTRISYSDCLLDGPLGFVCRQTDSTACCRSC